MNGMLVYTEKTNCQDCYKCIKHCPVKAIKVESHNASVIKENCIYCGKCVSVCQAQAKKIRDDTDIVKEYFRKNEKIICALAPSYVSEFSGIERGKLISAIKKLGFYAVSETALGAEIISEKTNEWLTGQGNGIYISSCCPSLVNLICKYYPELTDRLIPIDSPMIAHGKMLRKKYGKDFKIVFVGPCISKKWESDNENDVINAAITFSDLRNLFQEKSITPEKENEESEFIPYESSIGRTFPIEGGMLVNMKRDVTYMDVSYMSFSGFDKIKMILNSMKSFNTGGKIVLELMTCDGGCINGPGSKSKTSDMEKRIDVIENSKSVEDEKDEDIMDISELMRKFDLEYPVIKCLHTEDEITDVFEAVGKFSKTDELNCGGCGYENCREFAKAMLDGKAERAMCISYMRKVAQDKASVLLKKIPAGVVIADDELMILDSNERFAKMMGEDTSFVYESKPGLEGVHLPRLLSFSKLFEKVLETGEDIIEKDIRIGNKYLIISIMAIQRYKIVCGIIQDMKEKDVQRQMVIERTEDVIKENMLSVQKIAKILGENASYTESMLNSILDSYDEE